MTDHDHALLLDDVTQALDALPCDIAAESETASYALRIIDVRGGLLVAQALSGRRPPLRSSLVLEARSGDRLSALIDCAVASSNRGKFTLQPVSLRSTGDRRGDQRASSNELFLLAADQEIDTHIQDLSVSGMQFTSPIAVEIDSEVSGMLNVADRAFTISAIVRHCSPGAEGFDVGVQFRFLHDAETDLLTIATRTAGHGRRHGEAIELATSPVEDIRDRLRRFAA